MNHTVSLMLRYASKMVSLSNCINFRYEKERYTPYSVLTGRWYCPNDILFGEIMSAILYIDGAIIHYGYPDSIELEKKDGRNVLKVSSRGFTSALLTNQCDDNMLTDVNLDSLAAAGPVLPVVAYEKNTPTVSYVNYYDGTSCWDAIVCYAIRATGVYPYVRGYSDVCVSRIPSGGSYSVTSDKLISRASGSDYSNLISEISEKDIDGTPSAFVISNGYANARMMTRCQKINFDREWIMDPKMGLQFKVDYSCRKMGYDIFSFLGYSGLDLLDSFSVTDLGFKGEVDRLAVDASPERGFVTTVWCYHDRFCV